jgi:hypothetical protein
MANGANRKLGETVVDQGIKNSYYFNGRLLTASALADDQLAQRQQRQQLGQAIGDGVVRGFEVTVIANGATTGVPILAVTSGLALNRLGQAVALAVDAQLALTRQAAATVVPADLFADCAGPPAGPLETGNGVYVLLACPASAYQDQVPKRDLGQDGRVAGCGSRYVVEGLIFRLEPIDFDKLTQLGAATREAIASLLPSADPAAQSRLRNWLAHVCFGTEEIFRTVGSIEGLEGFPADPFLLVADQAPYHSAYTTYGALDALRASGQLGDDDVPLALVCWTQAGVQFVDAWSVRRPVVGPFAREPWPLVLGPRRRAEAEATFLQFEHQVQDLLLSGANLSSITATSRFVYLPAAGYLPVGGSRFNRDTFFAGLPTVRAAADPAFLRLVLHDSWYLEPLNLAAKPPITIYEAPEHPSYLVFVRRERQIVDSPPSAPPAPPVGPAPGRATIEVSIDPGDLAALQATLVEGLAGGSQEVAVDPKMLEVFVRDELGREFPARNVSRRVRPGLAGAVIRFTGGSASFRVDNLTPGTYRAVVRALGFAEAQQQKAVAAGQTAHFAVKLVRPKAPPAGGKPGIPPKAGPADWLQPPWYERATPIPKYVDWPWPPPEWFGRPPVVDPPPDEFLDWARDWAETVRAQHPDAPLDPGGIQVFVDPAYAPHSQPDAPYAYLTFGDGGAYVPIVLTPTDRALEADVSPAKAGLAGIGVETSEVLRQQNVASVDVIASGWKGLVADALGVGLDAAASVMTEASEKTDALQGSLQVFGGVDATIAQALQGQSIDGPAALANADPAQLARALQTAGLTQATPAFVHRLVDQARRAVSPGQWSLTAPALGLKDQDVENLQGLGITTQKQLLDRVNAGEGTEQIASALGVQVEQLQNVVGGITIRSGTDLQRERRAGAPVTRLTGVNESVAAVLLRAGVSTVAELAAANPTAVAGAFGGDSARASAVIASARALAGHG